MRPRARRVLWLVPVMVALAAGCRGDPPRDAGGRQASAADAPEPSRGCRAGTLIPAQGDRAEVTAGAERRSYLLDAPGGAADRPLPVVLVFHGFRGDAANLRAGAGWPALAAQQGFIAVHPDGHEGVRLLGTEGRGWDVQAGETRDAEMVRVLLDRLESERCVDRRRVYATGMSNGGFFANLLGCALAARVAAVAPVAGARALPGCAPERPVPVLLVHGRADRVIEPLVVRSARDWWAAANRCAGPGPAGECESQRGCAADVVLCEHDYGHVWPPDATARVWRFFRDHPRPAG